ncbi:vitellogenin [Spodoptera frugiperda]|uniref:Vitellogenin n=1 Tax=Spodoptera frugiperda TaxID=7108 RepID=A0A9R0DY17_SPOFR|nr:vitellogenin [Spodoptera frugiperda]
MKLILLTAFIAAVASSAHIETNTWPWKDKYEYHYNIDSYTWAAYDNSKNIGSAFKTKFTVRVIAPGHLIAKLSKPQYAKLEEEKISFTEIPSDIKYQPIEIFDEAFDIFVEGGRVKSLTVPKTLSVAHENLLKGLVSALQVDLSTNGYVPDFPNYYDKETHQGLFKKVETDVSGECETMYTVAPLSVDWHRELPKFNIEEDPFEVIKENNYGSCKKYATFQYGVPQGALWHGIATENEEKQFIKHTTEARYVVGQKGTIYKSETISTVFVSPLLYGKQKAELYSYVKVMLGYAQWISEDDEWEKAEEVRQVDSLILTMTESMFFPKASEQSIANAQKLLQDMTPLLQTPDKLPKADFLSKFNVLVRLIISFNKEQLKELTSSVEIAKSSKNIAKANMWTIYRDAVAQAGTIPAFEQIRFWITEKKVHGEEAAQLISAIASSLRYPTMDVQRKFFGLATNPEVMKEPSLNNSVLLAATKFMRFSKEHAFVEETVIPHLFKELKQAVEIGDSNKAQVYVRALGNLVHPAVLKGFAPYLDGTVKVSKYLRVQIIASLKPLANTKNENVRAALYSILVNTAEPYEVRVIAALNIFMAVPTPEMMQVMAHMTNIDPSTQVRAVLANGIKFAAKLKDPRFSDLAKTAQSVKYLVSEEKYGYRLSTDSIIDEYTSEDDIAYFRELSYIGSEDNYFPLYHRSALRSRGTGVTEESQVTLSVTGVQQLLEYIIGMMYEPGKVKADLKFSAKELAEKLNIKPKSWDPLEGSMFLENLNQQKLITFNEEDLKAFIANLIQNAEQLLKGVDVQYTKVLNHKQTYVAFPLASGVPFYFEYNEPLMLSFNGNVKFQFEKTSNQFYVHKNIDFTYARNLDGSLGFLDMLKGEYAAVGVINKLQLHFPVNLNTHILPKQIKLNFVLPEQDATLVHWSVWPYTTWQNVDSLLTVSETTATKYIERPAKVLSVDTKIGSSVGLSYHVQGYSYSSDAKELNKLFDADFLTNFGELLYQKDVALSQFNFKYIAKECENKDITLNLFYDKLYNQKFSGEMGPAAVMNDVSANSEARREEMVKRAATGIESAQVAVYDFSVVFNQKQKAEYVFSAAVADSFVDDKYQAVMFFDFKPLGLDQINVVYKEVKPKIVVLNFEEALKNKVKLTSELDIKYGNSDNIHFQGFGERSEKYTELLKNDPLAKRCLQQVSKDNFYQMDCYKMIIKAGAPDYFKYIASYKDLKQEYWNTTYNAYEMLKDFYSWEHEEHLLKALDDGKMEIEIQAYYYDNYINYKFTTKYGVFNWKNVQALEYFPYAMAYYAPISDWERAYNVYYGYQQMPYCSLDSSKVWTFSGRSYEYYLTSSWHAVMVDEHHDDLVILARRPSEDHEEVYVSYKTKAGDYLELEIKPSAVEVKSNTLKVGEGALTTYWSNAENVPLLQYHTMADGTQIFYIHNEALRLVYDKQRLVIFTADHRSSTWGLCGKSTSQSRDDFLTPYGFVTGPDHYGASFSLEGEFSDPSTVELKNEAKLKAYQPVTKYTNILRCDDEWSKIKNSVKAL